jgi:3-hydroxyacyl-CoA dehydrogenase
VAGNCPGFIGNRMIEQYSRQAGFLLDEGCSPQQVDKAIEKFGFAMGPFRMGDLAGNDIGWAIRKRRYVDKPGMKYSASADRLCELGRFGQKSGKGYYLYAPGSRQAEHDPQVDALVQRESERLGFARRRIGPEEILERCLLALVNEGAKILEENIAANAHDIDLVYLNGYGFPADKGGPMAWADAQGVAVTRMSSRFVPPAGAIIEVRVAAVLVRHARDGEANLRMGRWELVLPKIEFRPDAA